MLFKILSIFLVTSVLTVTNKYLCIFLYEQTCTFFSLHTHADSGLCTNIYTSLKQGNIKLVKTILTLTIIHNHRILNLQRNLPHTCGMFVSTSLIHFTSTSLIIKYVPLIVLRACLSLSLFVHIILTSLCLSINFTLSFDVFILAVERAVQLFSSLPPVVLRFCYYFYGIHMYYVAFWRDVTSRNRNAESGGSMKVWQSASGLTKCYN